MRGARVTKWLVAGLGVAVLAVAFTVLVLVVLVWALADVQCWSEPRYCSP